ncbi:sensor histidine kinase [Phenylobacterium montanum]|uniref:histidine kinase n=1 Tax=Phenylobacterium montanum TaxID=2823693 RepID=A0A975G0M7_9CAUL|nr:ATP-binding protein [Caulobacter sp. S6]QUD88596.1 hypothetical protein KCG34_01505 [Caulobacter sp. S6]
MTNTRQEKPYGPAPSRLAAPDWNRLAETLIRIVALLAVGAVALRVFEGQRLTTPEVLILGCILLAAAAFGLVAGLLAAAAGFIGFNLLSGRATPALDLQSRETLLLAAFGLFVAVVGFYTDTVRHRHRQARSLLEVGRRLSARASGPAVGRFFDVAKQKGPQVSRAPVRVEARQALSALVVIGAGLLTAALLQGLIGQAQSLLIALGAVIIVGGLTGARFGIAAGVTSGLAAAVILRPIGVPPPHPLTNQAIDLFLFATFGGGVGLLADRVRHEREALKTLVEASRDLSAGTDEAANRRVLLDSLSQITRGGVVQVFDDAGQMLERREGRFEADDAAGAEGEGSRWRTQRLEADGRDVGCVRWRFPGSPASAEISDQIAASLIDLGASAIVRSRLSAEKAEMAYVARAEHLRTVLLDAISHHFRSPLAGILGSVTSILNLPERHDRSVSRQLLLIIKEQAGRLSRYVDNFISLARLESESIEVNRTEVNIDSLIYDVWDTFGEVGSTRRYLHVEVDPEPIWSDPNLLAQVFGNILENAIKYSPEESVVRIRSHREGGWLVIEVADQGCGAPGDAVDRMFERFYRSRGAQAPGLGLGLYITRSLVEMLGGSVSARNRGEDGPGLVVTIKLPLSQS